MKLSIRTPDRTSSPVPPVPASGRPLAIAHRGWSSQAPENTVAAVRRAALRGVDLVEVDVQRTLDGALVLLHDAGLRRTTDVDRVMPARAGDPVGTFTLAELRRLDAGSWKSPAFAGEPVPLLEEVLDALHGTGTGLQLELKLPQLHPGIVEDVIAALTLHGSLVGDRPDPRRLVVQSFHTATMKEVKVRAPHLAVGLLGRPARENLAVLGTWADQVNPAYTKVDAGYVDAVHAAGMGCLTWTVDRPGMMRRVLRAGVDGVITNRPDALARVLGRSPLPA